MATKAIRRYTHNKTVLMDLKEGDLVVFRRTGYEHWAVYIGNGEVVHFTGDLCTFSTSKSTSVSALENAKIVRDSFWNVVENSLAINGNDGDRSRCPLPGQEVKQRALDAVGKTMSYNLTELNCEHFANECRYGKASSRQADGLKSGLKKAVKVFVFIIFSVFIIAGVLLYLLAAKKM